MYIPLLQIMAIMIWVVIDKRKSFYSQLRRLFVSRQRSKLHSVTVPEISFTLRSNRFAINTIRFMHGLCVATWAAFIPCAQKSRPLSDAAPGGFVLFTPGIFKDGALVQINPLQSPFSHPTKQYSDNSFDV